MRKFFIFFAFFSSILSPLNAWWDEGHMTIAKIAYDRLDPEVKKEADRLINSWAGSFPESSTFITASCWPDDVGNCGLNAFACWHHSSLPFDPNQHISLEEKNALIASLKGKDTLYAIEQCIITLESPYASAWSKGLMLRFLIHFVGDIHQPLHCISLCNDNFPQGDKGGNLFSLTWKDHPHSTLHAFWDSMCGLGPNKWPRPLSEEGENAIENLALLITTQFPEEFFSLEELHSKDFHSWREESYLLGVSYAYQGITLGQTPSLEYTEKGRYIASKRIALAGYRLGRLLNKTLKTS